MSFKTAGIKGFFDKIFEVKTDGISVWVNQQDKCIARFSEAGVNVGLRDETENVFSRSRAPMGHHEWNQFKRLMHDCYGFTLDEEWRPEWVRKLKSVDTGISTSQG